MLRAGVTPKEVAVFLLADPKQVLAKARVLEEQGVCNFSLTTSGCSLDRRTFAEIVKLVFLLHAEVCLRILRLFGFLAPEGAKTLKGAHLHRYHHGLETSLFFSKDMLLVASLTASGPLRQLFSFKTLGVDSVPLNILRSIPGHHLPRLRLSQEEILATFAVLRLCAGREGALGRHESRFCGTLPMVLWWRIPYRGWQGVDGDLAMVTGED